MDLTIAPLTEDSLDPGSVIFRAAFARFLHQPDPDTLFGDSDLFRTRWRAKNTRVLAARVDGVLVGSNVITRWGSMGWFGPLTVVPDRWDQGIAKALLGETERVFDEWRVTQRGLFTFSHSPKHIGLYQRFGYWPRYLTCIFQRTLSANDGPTELGRECRLYSQVPAEEQPGLLAAMQGLTGRLFSGLDVTGEVEAVNDQRIGETVILYDGSQVDGLAVCHLGAGSEAGSGATYVKFAAIAPGPHSELRLPLLLENIEALARSRQALQLEIGVNASHRAAFRGVVKRGYRSIIVGVAMHSPDEPAYHRPELTVLDDWR